MLNETFSVIFKHSVHIILNFCLFPLQKSRFCLIFGQKMDFWNSVWNDKVNNLSSLRSLMFIEIMNGGTYLTLWCYYIRTKRVVGRPASDEDSFECFHWLFGTHTHYRYCLQWQEEQPQQRLLIYEDSSQPLVTLLANLPTKKWRNERFCFLLNRVSQSMKNVAARDRALYTKFEYNGKH